ncbi:MAG: T9SS type A sorting domain-containing protein, partial [bacterium]|nr:T9SS type A sorting domain-containing protein [bacterium]
MMVEGCDRENLTFPSGLVCYAADGTYIPPQPGMADIIVLHPCYPNPFNSTTTIQYELMEPAFISIRIYDTLGRDVGILADDVFAAGEHSVGWNCADCASGVYFITMSGAGVHLTRKAILLR